MKKLVTIFILGVAVITLATLGTWQVQRLVWKQEIIDGLQAEYQKKPLENIYSFEKLKGLENQKTPILYGSVQGYFMNTPPIFLKPKTYDGKVGAHLIQPYSLKNGGTILVNRGWVEEAQIENLNPLNKNNDSVIGIFRKPDWNKFTSNNRPDLNIWAKPDIEEMAQYFNLQNVAPVMLYATTIEDNEGLILQDQKWYPRNKHLQYAVFWYGMIFVLLVLVGFAVRSKETN